MKKYLIPAFFLAIALCLLWPWSAVHASAIVDSGTCGEGLTWELDDSGILTISGTGDMENYDPSNYRNAPWEDHNRYIYHVEIRDGVTAIGSYAFHGCNVLRSVSIPDSVTRIREFAFMGCEELAEITIPGNVTSVGTQAFYCCKSLTQVIIPDSVSLVGGYAFSQCSKLTRVTLGTGVSTIETGAFSYCGNLQDLFFMGSAPAIKSQQLTGTIITAHYPYNDTSWTASVMHHYGGFITWEPFDPLCEHLLQETVLSSPTCTTPGLTHYGCSCGYGYTDPAVPATGHNIHSEQLPRSCTQDGYLYEYCTVCGEVMADAKYPATGHTFQNGACVLCDEPAPEWMTQRDHCGPQLRWSLDDDGTLTISGTGEMGDFESQYLSNCAPWGQYSAQIRQVIIEEGATSVGDSAFENCENLISVSIADSVQVIGERAFKNCTALTQLDLGNGLVTLEKEALRECRSLQFVTLPDSLTTIGKLAFAHCENLLFIYLPDNVTELGEQAFVHCGLVYVSLTNSINGTRPSVFTGCNQLWHYLCRSNGTPGSGLGFRVSGHINCAGDEITMLRIDATCSKPGMLMFTCSVCSGAQSVALPAAEHSWKAATCTEPRTCYDCFATEGTPLGSDHSWDEGKVIREPAEDQPGIRQHCCTLCGETKVEAIPFVPAAQEVPQQTLSGGTVFLIIIVSLVALIGGSGLLIWLRQRKA